MEEFIATGLLLRTKHSTAKLRSYEHDARKSSCLDTLRCVYESTMQYFLMTYANRTVDRTLSSKSVSFT